jgi:hypothetical protein
MEKNFRKFYLIPVLLALLMAACSSPSEDAASSNNNSEQPSVTQPSIAQNGTPTTTNNANASDILAPAGQPFPAQPKMAPGNKQPDGSQPAAKPATVTMGKAPKLVAPAKTIEFGKQPQDKTLVRNFQIRNTGNAELQIEDVKPG